ncbi:MAG: CRISPR-associated helicase Cas3' [Stellaceae bacterium]
MPSAFEFWAKSHREGDGAAMHSVPHHSLDVAASALVLLSALRPPVAVPAASLIALVALHDIGKFTRPFQAKVPKLWPAGLGVCDPPPAGHWHDDDGYALLCGALSRRLDPLFAHWRAPASRFPLLRAVTGHHGRPPRQFQNPTLPQSVACNVCIAAAAEFIDTAFSVIDPPPLPRLDPLARCRLAWFVAGLAVAADWLGSGRNWFPYVVAAEHTDLGSYWSGLALPRARQAAAEAGLIPARTATATGIARLFPEISEPRPLQMWAETVALPDGPVLITVEDTTGSGKTEAALVLAHRLMTAGKGTGLFFALPTMATADAMYARLGDAYRRLYEPRCTPSLVLAHGHSRQHPGFTASILDAAFDPRPVPAAAAADQTAGAQCAAWIGHDRRKAFLAEIGVGTIDQAVMAVLPTRHAPLRQLGLSQRILVVDEAHAYDAYLKEELEALLAFQAALGGSAIILSATLTARQRAQINTAFLSGLGATAEPDNAIAYPLATVASAGGIRAEPCAIAPDLRRRVAVERVSDEAAAIAAIAAAARAGATVAWVRNAVDDAIEAYAMLAAAQLDPMLFHARFAMGDRHDIERAVLGRFGHDSTRGQRSGSVLVATQVIEQSLDLDFDLIVTDLAPADLIIQRAGRLWRHDRGPRPIAGPRLLVLAPEPVPEPPTDWLGPSLRRTGYVYPDHALLWRSARALFEAGVIAVPEGIRALVELAYDRDAADAVPPGLAASATRAEGAELAAAAVGLQNVLKIEEPYCRDSGFWEPDVRTPTRLGEARVTFRLARCEDGEVRPWYALEDPKDPNRAWALSEVSVRQARLKGAVEEPGVTAVKEQWPAWDRDIPVLLLRRDSDGRWGTVGLDPRGREMRLTYDAARGLLFVNSGI